MSFLKTNIFPFIFIFFVIYVLIILRQQKKYFRWINDYWFFKRSKINIISTFFFIVFWGLLLLSLLDLRGTEKKIKGAIPDQKTIIIIDSSLSMLTEDVRPSRFLKAIQLARHFVKKSAGHQLSVVIFSDVQKRLIPFSDDVDLIDSRLAAMEKTNNIGGGSNISQAVSEAAQYFEADDEKSSAGNILLFTDAEESEGEFGIKVPNNVNLAIVGVGTLQGGMIPVRYEDGGFKGYKTIKNTPVVSKLDEGYIKSLGKGVKNFSYWIANSYTIPTDEILEFFRSAYKKGSSTGDMRVRPVFSYYILIPAVLMYIIYVVLGRFKSFYVTLLVFSLGLNCAFSSAEKKELSPRSIELMNKLKKGSAEHREVLKLGEEFLRDEHVSESEVVYKEYLKSTDSEEAKFNYITTLLRQNKFKEAIPKLKELIALSKNEDLKSKLRNNISMAINQDQKKSQDQKNDKNDKSESDDKKNDGKGSNDKKEEDKGQNKPGDKKNDESKDKSNSDQKNGKESDKNKDFGDLEKNKKDKGEPKDKKDNNQQTDQDKKEEAKKEEQKKEEYNSFEEKEQKIDQQRKMVKIPGMVKQILNDDRELQKRFMDTKTKEKPEGGQKRDW